MDNGRGRSGGSGAGSDGRAQPAHDLTGGAGAGIAVDSAAILASTFRRLRRAASCIAAGRRAATADTALNSSLRSAAATRSTL
ncbi:hypothetical protein OIE43_31950 [Streptomyces pseudovenezuelae]|uniref:hypothetical protein n=1 Tax=Streptomyces pseudovenezuelae TaxID=67350 RepID=UPI002E32697D|nr:hypothetical protein [Streptomyces pseudovenezuelae]